ncbi:hypothetical protein KM043_009890 [Ampulex compressa]|nr:hypothetical protein KM043_009890 [Ampulex compressa]
MELPSSKAAPFPSGETTRPYYDDFFQPASSYRPAASSSQLSPTIFPPARSPLPGANDHDIPAGPTFMRTTLILVKTTLRSAATIINPSCPGASLYPPLGHAVPEERLQSFLRARARALQKPREIIRGLKARAEYINNAPVSGAPR